MLKRLFSSKIRINLLSLFLSNADGKYFAREIERLTGDDFHGIVRELKNLEKIGLLNSEKDKNRVQYYVNKKFPVYEEIKKIFFKMVGAEGLLKKKLSKLSGIRDAFIYGSYAKGKENFESDIDLIIVGRVDYMKLGEMISEAEKQLNREINYIVYSQAEFSRKKKEKDGFLLQVLKDKKIILRG